MNEMKEYGVRGIALLPIDDQRIRKAINQFSAEYHIAVVTLNADIADTSRICFVGQNAEQIGQTAAGLMCDVLNGHPKFILQAMEKKEFVME